MEQQIALLEIYLDSETVMGGDGMQKGTVDIDIQSDEFGLPYFSARTLKGMLRKEAQWFVDHVVENKPAYKKAFETLFGKANKYGGDLAIYESLRFSDAKLSDSLYRQIVREEYSPRKVLQSISTIRTMTSIEKESGTAKDGSLRQVRVIHPHYTFFAPIFSTRSLTEVEMELFEYAVKLLRSIGMMRNRGKGEVTCSVHWQEQKKRIAATQHLENDQYNHIQITINVQEPLKINNVLGTSDATHALTYIPGHVIRGALVHAYLQDTNTPSSELETTSLFDGNQTQFWNGYLVVNGKRSVPFAQHLFETKESSKTVYSKKPKKVYNSLHEKEFSQITKQSPVRVNKDVMVIGEEAFYGKNVALTSSLHIGINASHRDNKIDLYRYEGIAPKQQFQAIVKVQKESDFVTWLRSKSTLTLWLGGARNSGYGRCQVTVSSVSASPEQTPNLSFQSDELYVIATSDWIIYNEQGQLISALDENWLSERIGAKVILKEQVVNTQITGGYISHWRAYQPMIYAVKAGSVFRYQVIEGMVEQERVNSLIEAGIGRRRNEGFGRLMILPTWKSKELITPTETLVDTETVERKHKQEEQTNRELYQFTKGMLNAQLQQLLYEHVNRWYSSLKGEVSNAQWGKLLQVATSTQGKIEGKTLSHARKIYKEAWNVFWKDSKKRQENKSKLGYDAISMEDSLGKRLKLEDFTMEFLQQKKWQVKGIELMTAEINDLFWSMEAFQLLIKNILRDGGNAKRGHNVK